MTNGYSNGEVVIEEKAIRYGVEESAVAAPAQPINALSATKRQI